MFKEKEIFTCWECGHNEGLLIASHPNIVECMSCGHPNDRTWNYEFLEDY